MKCDEDERKTNKRAVAFEGVVQERLSDHCSSICSAQGQTVIARPTGHVYHVCLCNISTSSDFFKDRGIYFQAILYSPK